jgi:hypothetical protein
MPGIIDSAPDCITKVSGAKPADDAADFIIQAGYQKCLDGTGEIMTFGPGSTYGDEGQKAETAYYVLTWLGIGLMVFALVAWVVYENRRLIAHAARLALPGARGLGRGEDQVQPGVAPADRT